MRTAEKRKHKETVKRYILFIIGLFFSGLGVAITKRGGLGVSPISSVPNVISLKWSFSPSGLGCSYGIAFCF